MPRCFIAIDLPQSLKERVALFRTDLPGARWVSPDQLHLTLSFLGSIEERLLPSLCSLLGQIEAPAFDLRFSRTGCFPDRRRPRVLWLGLEPEPRLTTLVGQIRSALFSCGIPQEERPFSPHITLARMASAHPHGAVPFLEHSQGESLAVLAVREFILFESTLTSQGAIHTPIMKFPLVPHEDPPVVARKCT